MSWVSLIISALKFVSGLFSYLDGRQKWKAGEADAIKREMEGILERVEKAKRAATDREHLDRVREQYRRQ